MGNALPFQVKGLRFDSCRVRLLSFSRSLFVFFCFFLKNKHVGSVLQHQLLGNVTSHLTVNRPAVIRRKRSAFEMKFHLVKIAIL